MLSVFRLLLLTIGLQNAVAFSQDVDPYHVKIVLEQQGSRPLPKKAKEKQKYDKAWVAACAELGNAISAGKGPWGFGVFQSFSCFRADKKVGGVEQSPSWLLSVVDGATQVTFKLFRLRSDGQDLVAEVAMPSSKFSFEFFRDGEFTDYVAYNILEQMPMAMIVGKQQLKGNQLTVRYFSAGKTDKFKYEPLPPPDSLTLYRIQYDVKAQSWRSQVAGTAKQKQVIKPKVKKDGKGKVLTGGKVVYELSPEAVAELNNGALFAHRSQGPGTDKLAGPNLKDAQIKIDSAARSGQLEEFLRKGNQGLLSNLLATAASGYVGLRYGAQILPSEGELGKLTKKGTFFGLLAEVRGGPLKGLRYYYDKQPKIEATLSKKDGDVKASVEFSRHVIGFSMGYNLGWFIDRITFDPKMGMWDYNAVLPTAFDEEGYVEDMTEFKLGRTFSMALEVGIEKLSDWYTLRGWYGLNTGYSLLVSGGKVTSNQFGVDAYFKAGPTIPAFGIPFRTALMGFYFYENVKLASGKSDDPAEEKVVITGINYSVGYAGAGVAISW